MALWEYMEYSRSWLYKRGESQENGHKESSLRTILYMTSPGWSQGDIRLISSPSPLEILHSNSFSTPKRTVKSSPTPPPLFTPTCTCTLVKYITVLRFTGWHCWLFIYLHEGLFSYMEHCLTEDSLRRDKETVLRHIKNCLFPGGILSFFSLASFPILSFYHVDLYEAWIRRDFLARCLSSSMWIKLPGLVKVCLESCCI